MVMQGNEDRGELSSKLTLIMQCLLTTSLSHSTTGVAACGGKEARCKQAESVWRIGCKRHALPALPSL